MTKTNENVNKCYTYTITIKEDKLKLLEEWYEKNHGGIHKGSYEWGGFYLDSFAKTPERINNVIHEIVEVAIGASDIDSWDHFYEMCDEPDTEEYRSIHDPFYYSKLNEPDID